ncbi:uncharacterized protein LOC134450254 [Engraulis encrasicolus]|uniref:uncharacterized protein LOC134450254 n=1 Tax=Engraulis encrasicolus TaxID=184585 RepID=UPI002FD193AC
MEQTTEYEYPPKIKVPRNLKIVIESFSRAVVERQPESIPHFATLYFAELVHFRAGLHWKEDFQTVVKKFHESRVDRLPVRGLGTMKNVTGKKPPLVATAALSIVRTQKMQEKSLRAQAAADKRGSLGPNVKVRITTLQKAERLKSTKDRMRRGMERVRESITGQTEQNIGAEVFRKKMKVKKKKKKSKLVKPAVPCEEPETKEECLSVLESHDDTPVALLDDKDTHERKDSATSLPALIDLEPEHSRLVYPPLPDEHVDDGWQQIIEKIELLKYAEANSQRAEPGSEYGSCASDDEDQEEAEDEEEHSAISSSEKKNQGDNKLVRPAVPTEDPECTAVSDVEWVPPTLEEDVLERLIIDQIKRLNRAKQIVTQTISQNVSATSQEIVPSSSALDLDFEEEDEIDEADLPQSVPPQVETKAKPIAIPKQQTSAPQKVTTSGTTEVAPEMPASPATQQTLYWALCLLAPLQPGSPSATGPQPMGAPLQYPQHPMQTCADTDPSGSPVELPPMVLPFLSPQTWGLYPATQLQNTQHASSQAQDPLPADHISPTSQGVNRMSMRTAATAVSVVPKLNAQGHKATAQSSPTQGASDRSRSTSPQMPMVMLTPGVTPAGGSTTPVKDVAHSLAASQGVKRMSMCTAATAVSVVPKLNAQAQKARAQNLPTQGTS